MHPLTAAGIALCTVSTLFPASFLGIGLAAAGFLLNLAALRRISR